MGDQVSNEPLLCTFSTSPPFSSLQVNVLMFPLMGLAEHGCNGYAEWDDLILAELISLDGSSSCKRVNCFPWTNDGYWKLMQGAAARPSFVLSYSLSLSLSPTSRPIIFSIIFMQPGILRKEEGQKQQLCFAWIYGSPQIVLLSTLHGSLYFFLVLLGKREVE